VARGGRRCFFGRFLLGVLSTQGKLARDLTPRNFVFGTRLVNTRDNDGDRNGVQHNP
jgi:hypothetical protein